MYKCNAFIPPEWLDNVIAFTLPNIRTKHRKYTRMLRKGECKRDWLVLVIKSKQLNRFENQLVI